MTTEISILLPTPDQLTGKTKKVKSVKLTIGADCEMKHEREIILVNSDGSPVVATDGFSAQLLSAASFTEDTSNQFVDASTGELVYSDPTKMVDANGNLVQSNEGIFPEGSITQFQWKVNQGLYITELLYWQSIPLKAHPAFQSFSDQAKETLKNSDGSYLTCAQIIYGLMEQSMLMGSTLNHKY